MYYTMVEKPIENAQNGVGLRIMERLLAKKGLKGKNLVFSPLSIYMMLTLLANAASKNSPILRNLLSLLKFKSIHELNSFLSELFGAVFGDTSAHGGPCVATANGVWLADDLPAKPSFRNLLQTLYAGELSHVDFLNKSSEFIEEGNAWIKEQTRGLIYKIFSHAQWYTQFYEPSTKIQDFHLLDGSSVPVPFMSSTTNRPVSVFDTFKVARLSYASGEEDFEDPRSYTLGDEDFEDPRHFTMHIFLPNDRDGLPSLVQRACSESGFFDRHCPPHAVPLEEFKIPKFKFDTKFKLTKILGSLGLESLFSSGSGFTEMVEAPAGKGLCVSGMLHAAAISVNEKGTEAAAVTVSDMMSGCLEEDPVKIKFVADHPFLFVITENESGCILFMGQVLDPSRA